MNADDWVREQETLHVLQSKSLMQQVAESIKRMWVINAECRASVRAVSRPFE